MFISSHRFYIHLMDDKGLSVARAEAAGFQPIYEDMLFSAVQSGGVRNDEAAPSGTLEPVWREQMVAGVAASLAGQTKTYPLDIFKHQVHELMLKAALDRKEEGDPPTYRWQVEVEEMQAPARRRIQVRIRRQPFPFADRTLSSLGIPVPQDTAPEGPRLYLAASVLEQLRSETANSLDVERADVLCGVLLAGDFGSALVVADRFPLAFETRASAAHVAFSPLTFEAARREYLRRADGLSLVGWHHNHPPKCLRGCLLVVPACENDSVFLSMDDYAVFLASFCAPHMIGLISGKGKGRRADDPVVRAYGWRDGVVREIPFTVYGG